MVDLYTADGSGRKPILTICGDEWKQNRGLAALAKPEPRPKLEMTIHSARKSRNNHRRRRGNSAAQAASK
jgi:hypothetical protein